jgi:hypothetical protein
MLEPKTRTCAVLTACVLAAFACGGDTTAPLDVTFGETTFVVVVNPVVNDLNDTPVPSPGTARSSVSLSVDLGPSATTGASGVGVLSPVSAGTRTLSLSEGSTAGEVSVNIAEQDLREVAIALDGSGATVMANVPYAFGGQVIELTPSTPLSEVNDALAMSNVIVFLRGGIYTGDLVFAGSNVTLFGEGEQGGQVTLNGNVTVSGSGNRIRGARITGDLLVPGSDAGISFSHIAGAFDLGGSSATLLSNSFCGSVTFGGSNPTLLGNAGLSPIPPPPGGC